MKSMLKGFALSVLLLLLASFELFSEEITIILATQKALDGEAGKYLHMIYAEAFKRLGLAFEEVELPAARASIESDAGRVDGELTRTYIYQSSHPDVIRIEEPHWTSGFIALSINPKIKLDGWESLKNTDYSVIYTRGIQVCETNLPKFVKPEKLSNVTLAINGLQMVTIGRADLFIDAENNIMYLLDSDELKNSGLTVVGVMEKFTGHAYLHVKHKELALKLALVLKEMRKEGLFEKYQKAANLKLYFK
jgi:hypothetical protein